MTKYNLTAKEQKFVTTFLIENECGCQTPEGMLQDNMSCQSLEDIMEWGYSRHEAGGFVSSLEDKGVLSREEREGDTTLWWATDEYLETITEF